MMARDLSEAVDRRQKAELWDVECIQSTDSEASIQRESRGKQSTDSEVPVSLQTRGHQRTRKKSGIWGVGGQCLLLFTKRERQ